MEDDGEGTQITLEHPDKLPGNTDKPKNMPKRTAQVSSDGRYKEPKVPRLTESVTPTRHSSMLKPSTLTDKQEVLLAALDANLNKIGDNKRQIPALCEAWVDSAADILTGAPPRLPILREHNHPIPLKDDDEQYHHHLPCCPDALKVQLMEKIEKYTTAGWWEPVNVPQAAPRMCIPKKNGKLWTVIDCRKRNGIQSRT